LILIAQTTSQTRRIDHGEFKVSEKCRTDEKREEYAECGRNRVSTPSQASGQPDRYPPLERLPLEQPAAFESWRKHELETRGVPRQNLVAALLEIGTPIATLRASMLLTSFNPEQSRVFAETGYRQGKGSVRLMSKTQLAILNTLAAWGNTESQRLAVGPYLLVLEDILREVKQLNSTEELNLEIEVRAHSILSEGYLLVENYPQARLHAAQAQLLAPTIGLEYLVATASFQLGNISLAEGKAVDARNQSERVLADTNATKLLTHRAHINLAHTMISLGDDTEALRCLEAYQVDGGSADRFLIDHHRSMTFRFPLAQQTDDLPTPPTAAARTKHFKEVLEKIIEAQETRPDKVQEIEEKYLAAQAIMNDVSRTSVGWGKLTQRIWSAFISLQLKDYSIAHTRSPSVSELETLPPFYRALGLCVLIEALEHLLPVAAGDLLEAARRAVTHFNAFESHVVDQVAAKLSLFTPRALALCARFSRCPDAISIAGNASIINLNHRPISVYNRAGMRPVHAARVILEQFDWDASFIPSDGGGQLNALSKALFRPYYERICWYRGVSGAHLVFVLMCLREVSTQSLEQENLLQGARDLKRRYGFVPTLQKVERIAQLEQIERTLTLMLRGEIVSTSAAKLLFGRGS
jgi:tetratricopeptide (TPR) repeat protein